MPSSAPDALAAVGDTLFFTAKDGIHGPELWKSDGTEAGTVLVKNINPNDSDRRPGSSPRNLTVVEGWLYFTARDGTRGRELWKSDGTRAGTVLVKNINPTGSASSHPSSLTAMGGRLFFSADDGTHGRELWRSNGSPAGTVLVKNIAPKGAYYSSSDPSYLTVMGRRLFFSAEDGTHGRELWKSDGSRAGTVLVKDIDPVDDVPHYPGSDPISLTAMGGRLFFSAADGTRGEELWKSDGSRAGTTLVRDINPGGANSDSYPSSLTAMGGRLFFSARDGTRGEELWGSDGSRAGTVLVKNINLNRSGAAGSDPSYLTAMRDRLFFSAYDGTSGAGLWKSDGSRAGTVLVTNIDLYNYDYGYSDVLTPVGGRLFFAADDATHGVELWRSNGSTAGTVLVKDIDPCDDSGYAESSYPSSLTAMGGQLFFAADDGTHGEELWKSDGTTEGTVLVKDIKTGTTG